MVQAHHFLAAFMALDFMASLAFMAPVAFFTFMAFMGFMACMAFMAALALAFSIWVSWISLAVLAFLAIWFLGRSFHSMDPPWLKLWIQGCPQMVQQAWKPTFLWNTHEPQPGLVQWSTMFHTRRRSGSGSSWAAAGFFMALLAFMASMVAFFMAFIDFMVAFFMAFMVFMETLLGAMAGLLGEEGTYWWSQASFGLFNGFQTVKTLATCKHI